MVCIDCKKIEQRHEESIAISVDQFLNTLFGGSPDECISTMLWNEYPNSFLRKLVDVIFGKDHCKRSAENDDHEGVLK